MVSILPAVGSGKSGEEISWGAKLTSTESRDKRRGNFRHGLAYPASDQLPLTAPLVQSQNRYETVKMIDYKNESNSQEEDIQQIWWT